MKQVSWWVVVPLDALELMRLSSVKVLRALQTFARIAMQLSSGIARHRCEACANVLKSLASHC